MKDFWDNRTLFEGRQLLYWHCSRRFHGEAANTPVAPDVWDEFAKALKRGPTPEQARAVKRPKSLPATSPWSTRAR